MKSHIIVDSGFKTWNIGQLPDLTGKNYFITGGNSGLGFETAKYLGAKGANLILACRSAEKAEKARAALAESIKGKVDVVLLDLGDLDSIRRAADDIHQRFDKLDAVINNAGIMQCPKQTTKDGFEKQVGTNHLGHFLLSGLLLDLVEAANGRFVTVSSVANRSAALNLDDYMSEKSYSPTGAYAQAKLSNLLFALELDRRLKASGSSAISIACHPGYSNTNLQSSGPTGLLNAIYKIVNPLFAQPAEQGAQPSVLAAAGLEAKRGAYYGPQNLGEFRGPVGDAKVPGHAMDKNIWKKLWEKSEQLVGYRWPLTV